MMMMKTGTERQKTGEKRVRGWIDGYKEGKDGGGIRGMKKDVLPHSEQNKDKRSLPVYLHTPSLAAAGFV